MTEQATDRQSLLAALRRAYFIARKCEEDAAQAYQEAPWSTKAWCDRIESQMEASRLHKEWLKAVQESRKCNLTTPA